MRISDWSSDVCSSDLPPQRGFSVIHIYDGNNVRLRAMTTPALPGQKRLSLRQEYQRTQTGTHIWVWDGVRHTDRRKAIYPAYKTQREPMEGDHLSQTERASVRAKGVPSV